METLKKLSQDDLKELTYKIIDMQTILEKYEIEKKHTKVWNLLEAIYNMAYTMHKARRLEDDFDEKIYNLLNIKNDENNE